MRDAREGSAPGNRDDACGRADREEFSTLLCDLRRSGGPSEADEDFPTRGPHRETIHDASLDAPLAEGAHSFDGRHETSKDTAHIELTQAGHRRKRPSIEGRKPHRQPDLAGRQVECRLDGGPR